MAEGRKTRVLTSSSCLKKPMFHSPAATQTTRKEISPPKSTYHFRDSKRCYSQRHRWLVGHFQSHCQQQKDLAGSFWQPGLQPRAQLGGFKRGEAGCPTPASCVRLTPASQRCAEQSLTLHSKLWAIPRALPKLGSVAPSSALPGKTAASLPWRELCTQGCTGTRPTTRGICRISRKPPGLPHRSKHRGNSGEAA